VAAEEVEDTTKAVAVAAAETWADSGMIAEVEAVVVAADDDDSLTSQMSLRSRGRRSAICVPRMERHSEAVAAQEGPAAASRSTNEHSAFCCSKCYY
jgi:hypothetical protein